jgi:hypothetical protein
MRNWIVSMCALALMLGGLSLVARADDASNTKTVEGELVDMHCYAKDNTKKGDDHAACCKKCLQGGEKAGVVGSDGKALTIVTDGKALADYAAKTIRVTGTVDDDKATITPTKIQVKDGDDWKDVPLADAK